MVDGVRVLDVVINAQSSVAAPVGAVVRVVRVQVRAESHDYLARVLPCGRCGGQLTGWCPERDAGRRAGVEDTELQIVEEVLFLEKVMTARFQALARCGVLGHETDVFDGADVEH